MSYLLLNASDAPGTKGILCLSSAISRGCCQANPAPAMLVCACQTETHSNASSKKKKRETLTCLGPKAPMMIQRSHQLLAPTSLSIVPDRPRHPLRLFMPPLPRDCLQDGRSPDRCAPRKIQSCLFAPGMDPALVGPDGICFCTAVASTVSSGLCADDLALISELSPPTPPSCLF